jgi:hypothetical protein
MMTQQEFLNSLKSRNAVFAPASQIGNINIINVNLQRIRAAVLPKFITDLYQVCSGIKLGNGYIFGPVSFGRSGKHPIPNIFQVNNELTNLTVLRGKTIFGRNDLCWFAFDSFGTCMMLDNLGLHVLRKYDDPYRAMLDCLIGGQI